MGVLHSLPATPADNVATYASPLRSLNCSMAAASTNFSFSWATRPITSTRSSHECSSPSS